MTNPFAIKQIIDERNAALELVRVVETLNAELEEKLAAKDEELAYQRTRINRLLPYVDAFRREETRADLAGRDVDELRMKNAIAGMCQAAERDAEPKKPRAVRLSDRQAAAFQSLGGVGWLQGQCNLEADRLDRLSAAMPPKAAHAAPGTPDKP